MGYVNTYLFFDSLGEEFLPIMFIIIREFGAPEAYTLFMQV